jgi:hypothetical protein
MRVRYRETDLVADVRLRHDSIEGLMLVGSRNVFFLDGELESNAAGQEWTIEADTFE